eukprot:COSAG02_NODE_3839_length_6162_cov_4.006762_5_plen_61_part_00
MRQRASPDAMDVKSVADCPFGRRRMEAEEERTIQYIPAPACAGVAAHPLHTPSWSTSRLA